MSTDAQLFRDDQEWVFRVSRLEFLLGWQPLFAFRAHIGFWGRGRVDSRLRIISSNRDPNVQPAPRNRENSIRKVKFPSRFCGGFPNFFFSLSLFLLKFHYAAREREIRKKTMSYLRVKFNFKRERISRYRSCRYSRFGISIGTRIRGI